MLVLFFFDYYEHVPGSIIVYNTSDNLYNLLGYEKGQSLCMTYSTFKTDCYYDTTSLHPVFNAANKHIAFSNYVKSFRFIVWISGLSLQNYPTPYTNTGFDTRWYTSTYYTRTYSSWITSSYTYYTYDWDWYSSYSYDNPTPRPNNSVGILLIVSIVVIVVVFISFVVAVVIRRCRRNQTNITELRNFSDEESTHEDEPKMQPMQTNYPIFVQSTAPTNYPIFVQSNPMMINPMMTPMMNNTNQMMVSNTGMFPQPTVFYPAQTNQNSNV